ncbi:MAG TPA: hypothetical protein PK152_21390 [Anaerolineales bacterium]|nr:hypothetical protein [Anaerolineales bacterium]
MKSKKWIWWILGILLTLIVLSGVGLAAFRVGIMRSAAFEGETFPRWAERFNGDRSQHYGDHGFDHDRRGSFHPGERGGFSLLSPVFGLFRLAILGGLVWLGYTLFKRSGWRLVNVHATQTVTPTTPTAETPSAQGDEKKDEA